MDLEYDCLIAFGSNQGDSVSILAKTVEALQCDEILVVATSQPTITKPVGGPADQDSYLNAAIRVQTLLEPPELHQVLVRIERELGRVREQRWGSRKIDLDLVLFSDCILESEHLTIPHPRMSFRRFVLEPALEVAGEMIHPRSGCSLKELVDVLNRPSNLLLIVCLNEKEVVIADKIKQRLSSTWTMEVVEVIGKLHEYQSKTRLVTRFRTIDDTSWASVASLLNQAAINFAGPTLELKQDVDTASLELLAAIEAIEK